MEHKDWKDQDTVGEQKEKERGHFVLLRIVLVLDHELFADVWIVENEAFQALVVVIEMGVVDEIAGEESYVRSGRSGVAQGQRLEIVVGVVDQLVQASSDDTSSSPDDHSCCQVEDESDEGWNDERDEEEEPEPPLKHFVLVVALRFHGEVFGVLEVGEHGYEGNEDIVNPKSKDDRKSDQSLPSAGRVRVLVARVTLGEGVDVKDGILELDESLDGEQHETVEGETEEEGREPALHVARLLAQLFVIVDAVAAWYDDEEEAQEVGKDEMSEKEVGLVQSYQAPELEQRDQ